MRQGEIFTINVVSDSLLETRKLGNDMQMHIRIWASTQRTSGALSLACSLRKTCWQRGKSRS